MSKSRQKLGRWGEDLAAAFLIERGCTIVARNVHTPYGEIDLIARTKNLDGSDITIFVEVKTRSSSSFGLPEQSVTRLKREHMLNSALYFLQDHPELDGDYRIDVIAIQRERGKEPVITIFEDAFGQV
jgi:putative endonuclease